MGGRKVHFGSGQGRIVGDILVRQARRGTGIVDGIGCSCSVRVRCGSRCAGRRTEVALAVAGDLQLLYNNC